MTAAQPAEEAALLLRELRDLDPDQAREAAAIARRLDVLKMQLPGNALVAVTAFQAWTQARDRARAIELLPGAVARARASGDQVLIHNAATVCAMLSFTEEAMALRRKELELGTDEMPIVLDRLARTAIISGDLEMLHALADKGNHEAIDYVRFIDSTSVAPIIFTRRQAAVNAVTRQWQLNVAMTLYTDERGDEWLMQKIVVDGSLIDHYDARVAVEDALREAFQGENDLSDFIRMVFIDVPSTATVLRAIG